MANPWIIKFKVRKKDSAGRPYVVSRARNGEWACNCPAWTLRRKICKHIHAVQSLCEAAVFNGISIKNNPLKNINHVVVMNSRPYRITATAWDDSAINYEDYDWSRASFETGLEDTLVSENEEDEFKDEPLKGTGISMLEAIKQNALYGGIA